MKTKEATDLLTAIENKRAALQKRGRDIERAGDVPEDILQWIYDLKLFKLIVPEAFGGRPTPLPDMLRVFDVLSAADGSIGWLVHIGAAGGYFAPSFREDVAEELFSPREAVIAGSGFPAGRARKVNGGYKVSGRWFYASGCQYASLFTANATIEKGSTHTVRAFAFWPDQVKVIEDWNAFGMKGTASHTFVVDDVFVPDERSFVVGDVMWSAADPMYRLPFDMLAVTTIAAVIVGLTRRFFELARELPRWGELTEEKQKLADDTTHLRHLFYVLADGAWSALKTGDVLGDEEHGAIIQGIRRLIDDSIHCVQRVFPFLGMRVLREHETINRVYRDLQTAGQHVYLRG